MSISITWTSAPSACLETKFYWRSQEEFKVKYIKARIAEVTSNGQQLIVKGEDTLVKRPITIPFDMVVHAIGMDPNVDNMLLASVFGVKLEPHGFIDRAKHLWRDGRDEPARCVRGRRGDRARKPSTIPSPRGMPRRCRRSARCRRGSPRRRSRAMAASRRWLIPRRGRGCRYRAAASRSCAARRLHAALAAL